MPLILDIGLHKGLDTEFYLKKGFEVVGVEASPDLAGQCRTALGSWIDQGKLTIVEQALADRSGETVNFYINPDKDDWGSLFKDHAEKGIGSSVEITVSTITLSDIFDRFGTPYYIKCDIEGGDRLFARQLLLENRRPQFVSIEATSVSDLAHIHACGFDRFQIVNQWRNPWQIPPEPAREGVYAPASFTGETSGLFGRELDPGAWSQFDDVVRDFVYWQDLMRRNANLAWGWADVHATTSRALEA